METAAFYSLIFFNDNNKNKPVVLRVSFCRKCLWISHPSPPEFVLVYYSLPAHFYANEDSDGSPSCCLLSGKLFLGACLNALYIFRTRRVLVHILSHNSRLILINQRRLAWKSALVSLFGGGPCCRRARGEGLYNGCCCSTVRAMEWEEWENAWHRLHSQLLHLPSHPVCSPLFCPSEKRRG